MARFPAVFFPVSAICVAVLLGVACVGTASAPDSGARIRFAVSRIGEVAVTGEGTFRGSATYALAPAATVQSGQRYTGALLALTASTTSVAPTPNPSMFGAPVTLTATVSPSAATGQVTF